MVMTEFISEEEKELMTEFADTPSYKRQPEQLVPDEESEEAEQ